MLVKQLKLEKGNIQFFNDRFVMLPSTLLPGLQKRVDDDLPKHIYYASKEASNLNFSNTLKSGLTMNRTEYMGLVFNLLNSQGEGVYNIDSIDFEKKQAVVSLDESAIARAFGSAKVPVDHVARGLLSGAFSVLFNDPSIEAIEHKCVSVGDKQCSFVIKQKETFDSSGDLFKYQVGLSQAKMKGYLWW